MFTGIIEAIGKVREPEKLGDGVRLTIDTPAGWLKGTEIGESIAVNGACMTVVNIEGDTFQIEVSAESLSKTCGLDTWGEVNLEKRSVLVIDWTVILFPVMWTAWARWK